MMQPSLNFDGITYDRERDGHRLRATLDRIRMLMLDGCWRTPAEIRDELSLGADVAVTARLRDLRKGRFGAYAVLRRCRSAGVHEYCVRMPEGLRDE